MRLVGATPFRQPAAPCRGERGLTPVGAVRGAITPSTRLHRAFSTVWLRGPGGSPCAWSRPLAVTVTSPPLTRCAGNGEWRKSGTSSNNSMNYETERNNTALAKNMC